MSEKEFRAFGPPGTGKTFWLARQIERAVQKFDGVQSVCVASFTKTASREISRRAEIKPSSTFGTLHSICFNLLGSPIIAEGEARKWNDWIETKGMPTLRLSGAGASLNSMDEPDWSSTGYCVSAGDDALIQLQTLRARCMPREQWPSTVRVFDQLWSEWKHEASALDFTDLIDVCVRERVHLPAQVRCAFFDEVQDFTKLELSLVRMWGENLEYSILVGDDDQCIFSFKGATPDAFLFPPIDDTRKTILSQSYRVPISVHALANKWIRNVQSRQEKEYKPTDIEGLVSQMTNATWKYPEPMVEDVEKKLDAGRSVMILAACSYQLAPTIRVLRNRGVPFHNPYRRRRGDWNPLHRRATGTSSADRMLAYMRPSQDAFGDDAHPWNNRLLGHWVEHVKSDGLLLRGAKKRIELAAKTDPDGLPPLIDLFTADAAMALWDDPEVDWFMSKVQASKQSVYEYPINIYKARGVPALVNEPDVTVGTIHSVKGGEADCSPGDEPILTTNRGYVSIEDLDPCTDKVVSFNSDHHKIHRGGPRRPNGYSFQKVERFYDGDLLIFTTPRSRTRVTPNHYLTVRWNKKTHGAFCVYLMRRGDWFRIGTSQLHYKHGGQSGVLARMRREGATDGWVLGIFSTQREALFNEQLLSHTYHVPDLDFNLTRRSENQLDTNDLKKIWAACDSKTGANKLLSDKKLDVRWPLFSMTLPIRRRQTGTRNRWPIRAANFIDGFMDIPTDPGAGQHPIWETPVITREAFTGKVYSLDVERWQHYISGGAIVHNCVYVFPDLSMNGLREWQGEITRDPIIRLFYVAFTRARHELHLCMRATSCAVQWQLQ